MNERCHHRSILDSLPKQALMRSFNFGTERGVFEGSFKHALWPSQTMCSVVSWEIDPLVGLSIGSKKRSRVWKEMPCCTRNSAVACSVLVAVLCAASVVIGIVPPPSPDRLALAVIGRGEIEKVLREGILDQRVITSKNSTGYASWVSSDYKGKPPVLRLTNTLRCTNPIFHSLHV